jgi:hypothetical protein
MFKLSCAVLCFVALVYPLHGARAAEDLYGARGISPDVVKQGRLGSCYFHAVIAALAQHQQATIRAMIQSNSEGSYTVTFGDGQKETAYPEDLRYTHESGYDLSDGQWVAVLFRAYAQRVLRQSMRQAIDASDVFVIVKQPAEQLVASSDEVVLAYDRAIRAEVDQDGNIDRAKLETRLKGQMAPIALPDTVKDNLIATLESGGFFDKMVDMIKQNGEIFGAYRAVGQGGIADRVMKTMSGSSRFQENESEAQASASLETATRKQLPITACTAGSRFYQQILHGQSLPPEVNEWYVNAHCYTVLGYDSSSATVNLRNPWARHPDKSEGNFTLPLITFMSAYLGIVTPR